MTQEPAEDRTVGEGPYGASAERRRGAFHAISSAIPSLAAWIHPDDAFYVGPRAAAADVARLASALGSTPLLLEASPAAEANPGAEPLTFILPPLGADGPACLSTAARLLADRAGGPTAMIIRPLPGSRHAHRFFPHISGEVWSFNPYAWNEYIAPADGVARIVFGLGTRLADRSGDEFSRVLPLAAPNRRPETGEDECVRYAQRRVDFFDLDARRVATEHFIDLAPEWSDIPIPLFASVVGEEAAESPHRALTFDRLSARTTLAHDLHAIMAALRGAAGDDVCMNFSAEVRDDGAAYTLHLGSVFPCPAADTALPRGRTALLSCHGAVVGRPRETTARRIVYVAPAAYAELAPQQRYEIARLIGRVNRNSERGRVIFAGPGRWATTSPNLGIPVTFAEVSRAAALCEIVTMHDHLTPEVSMGSHVFNELVAMNILYLAIFPGRPHNEIDRSFFDRAPNRLAEVVPGAERWAHVLKVIDAGSGDEPGRCFVVRADARKQEAVIHPGPQAPNILET